LIAKASGHKSEAFDKILDKTIAGMAPGDVRKAQEAASRFVEGSRIGDTIATANP